MPGQGDAPPPQAAATSPTPAELLSQMDPTEGISFEPLFDQKLDDDEDRLARLEAAVQSVRNDLDGVVIPSVMKLVAAKKEAEEVAKPIAVTPPAAETQANAEVPATAAETTVAATETAQATAMPQKTAATTTAVAPAATPAPVTPAAETKSDVIVKGVRIGDHPDATRLVIDISSGQKRDIALAHEGTQLVVDLGAVAWTGKAVWQAETAKLVASWKYADGKFYADLLSPAVIKKQMILPSADTKGMYRIVIDLYSKDVHK